LDNTSAFLLGSTEQFPHFILSEKEGYVLVENHQTARASLETVNEIANEISKIHSSGGGASPDRV
jgi:hypothetical protein